tara:strand:+ start:128 stop:412 length:285 start_codon:yes stop_codon:yes gene_type:complete
MIEGLPKMDPKYLTDNDLWDSSWLKEKYPERFTKFMIDFSKWPFKKGSYEYYFDMFFDIPEGIHEYSDKEAHKFAVKCMADDRTTDTNKKNKRT